MVVINKADRDMRLLHHACESGDLKTIARLIYIERVPADACAPKTQTHRHFATQVAAARHQPKALQMLFDYGAKPFVRSKTNMTLDAIAEKHEDYKSWRVVMQAKAAVIYPQLMRR